MAWYQVPPLDFVSENLAPNKILDHRTVAFNLQPQVIVPTEQLLDRANQLRQETLSDTVVPAAAAIPNATGPTPMMLPPTSEVVPAPILAPDTFAPAPTLGPAPFAPPMLPAEPQQGPPLVSPPLR